MTIVQLINALRARWITALVTFGGVLGLALAVTLLQPSRYTATASVVLDVKSPDPITGLTPAGFVTPTYISTQVEVLRSGRTASSAIQSVGLLNNPSLRAEWEASTGGQGEFEGWVVDLLLRNLTVTPLRESSAMRVAFVSQDPGFSARMANAFVQAYIDTTVEARKAAAQESSSFFEANARKAREELEAAQAKLTAFQRSSGILATDERLDVETARLNELSSQLVMLQTLAAESRGRATQAGANRDQMQEVVNNPLVAQLNLELARYQSRLEELTSRLGDNNPQVVEVRATVAELRRRIAAETNRVAGSVGVNDTVTQSRLAAAQAALAEQRARVLKLKQQRDEVAVLERDVDSAKLAYQGMVQKANLSTVESRTTQTNASFLQRAFVPARPSSPNAVLNVAVGVLAGLVLAVIAAMVREHRDRRLRSVQDIETELGVPMLGTIPKFSAKQALPLPGTAGLQGQGA